jgi:hypothetical protein
MPLDSPTRIIVPKGERYKIIFTDTTYVALNQESILSLYLGDIHSPDLYQKARVEGEAYFFLSGDTVLKYFKILAGNSFITSSGGRLLVSYYKEKDSSFIWAFSSKIAMTGTVDVDNYGPGKALKLEGNKATLPYEVGDMVAYWALDKIDFAMTLREVLDYVEKRYKVQAAVEEQQLLARPVFVKADAGVSLEMFCEIMKNETGLDYKIKGDKVTFYQISSM